MSDIEDAALIHLLYAQIKSSSLNRGRGKEPYDRAEAMIPVAYAMFRVLGEAGRCSGYAHWKRFLHEALDEVLDHLASRGSYD